MSEEKDSGFGSFLLTMLLVGGAIYVIYRAKNLLGDPDTNADGLSAEEALLGSDAYDQLMTYKNFYFPEKNSSAPQNTLSQRDRAVAAAAQQTTYVAPVTQLPWAQNRGRTNLK